MLAGGQSNVVNEASPDYAVDFHEVVVGADIKGVARGTKKRSDRRRGVKRIRNVRRVWAETALTLDAFAYRSVSHFTPAGAAAGEPPQQDPATTIGGDIRAQLGSLELNVGLYNESHDHAQMDGTGATALVQYNELSYIVFPWLVPAVRVEYIRLSPDNGSQVYDLRIIPGIAVLIRPNIKVTLVGQIENSNGAPPGGWAPINGFIAPSMGTITEFEAITLGLATAF